MNYFSACFLLIIFLIPDSFLVKAQQEENVLPSELITLNFTEKPLQEVVAYIREQTKKNIVIDPDISIKISIHLENIPWMEALQTAVIQAKCEVTQVSEIIWKVSQPPIVSIDFSDHHLKLQLFLFPYTPFFMPEYSEKPVGKLPVRFKDIPFREALRKMFDFSERVVLDVDFFDKAHLNGTKTTSLGSRLKTKAFDFDFTQNKRLKDKLLKEMEQVLNKEKGTFFYDEKSDIVFITDTEAVLEYAEILYLSYRIKTK